MKNSGFEDSLLSSGKLMRRGFSVLAESGGKAVALIAAVIAVLVTFTEIGFYELNAERLTANALMVLIASYVIYFSLENAGERLGRESEEYKSAAAEYIGARDLVTGEMLPALREFVRDYRDEELSFRRRNALIGGECTPEEYEQYLSGGKCTRRERRVFARASRMKPIRLTAAMLLGARAGGESEEIRDPEGRKRLMLILRLIPSTLCTVFTVSVMLGARDGLTAVGVIESLLHLCCLPIVGLRGYTAGYEYATDAHPCWLRIKTRLLRSFLARQGVGCK